MSDADLLDLDPGDLEGFCAGLKRKERPGPQPAVRPVDPSADAAEGALLGACIGDAAGGPLEFPPVDYNSAAKVWSWPMQTRRIGLSIWPIG